MAVLSFAPAVATQHGCWVALCMLTRQHQQQGFPGQPQTWTWPSSGQVLPCSAGPAPVLCCAKPRPNHLYAMCNINVAAPATGQAFIQGKAPLIACCCRHPT